MIHILLWASILVLAILVCLIAEWRKRLAFEQRFPRISDEEFVARCPAGTRREVALKVRRIVANSLGVEYARIHPSSSFVNDLGAD